MDIQLPQGPDTDSYRQYIFVNIIDDSNGITVYYIETPIVVMPNDELTIQLINSIANNDVNSQLMIDLNSGNMNVISKNVMALSSVFNTQSFTQNTSLSPSSNEDNNQQMASLREFMVEKLSQFNASDLSSVKLLASTLSVATKTPQQVSPKLAVRKLFQIKLKSFFFLNHT